MMGGLLHVTAGDERVGFRMMTEVAIRKEDVLLIREVTARQDRGHDRGIPIIQGSNRFREPRPWIH